MINIKIVIIVSLSLTVITLSDAFAQGRQTYPLLQEEEYIEVRPGEKYNCPGCQMIFQGTEFTVWQHLDGNRVVVAVPITDNATFRDEGFVYNYCFTGVKHAIPGMCDDPDYEKYKVE